MQCSHRIASSWKIVNVKKASFISTKFIETALSLNIVYEKFDIDAFLTLFDEDINKIGKIV